MEATTLRSSSRPNRKNKDMQANSGTRTSRSLIVVRNVVRNRYGFRGVLQRFPRLAQTVALEPLAKLAGSIFRRWHTAVADHALGKPNRGLGVYILCVYMLDVGQAVTRRVLDTPRPPPSAPLNLRP